MANIDDFKANLIGGGARANQFRVTITPPSGNPNNSKLQGVHSGLIPPNNSVTFNKMAEYVTGRHGNRVLLLA